MLRFEFRSSKFEVRKVTHSKFNIRNSVFNGCVQTVSSLSKVGGLSNNLHTVEFTINSRLCSIWQFITNSCTAFATSFAPLFDTSLYQLNGRLIPAIHSTNKNNEILYKLITINKGE